MLHKNYMLALLLPTTNLRETKGDGVVVAAVDEEYGRESK